MKRGLLISLSALFVCSILNAKDPAEDLKKIQGKWVFKSLERGGEQPPKALLNATITISGNKLTLEISGKDSPEGKAGALHFTMRLDSSKKPKEIDLVSLQESNKGAVMTGIYLLRDGELSMCIPDDATEKRPTEMKSPKGSSLILQVLKRP